MAPQVRQTARQDFRYRVNTVSGAYDIHVVEEQKDDWQVWLNTEDADFDGLIIGVGATMLEAVADAEYTLDALISKAKILH